MKMGTHINKNIRMTEFVSSRPVMGRQLQDGDKTHSDLPVVIDTPPTPPEVLYQQPKRNVIKTTTSPPITLVPVEEPIHGIVRGRRIQR
jgi:hypothetical protein